VTVSHATEKIYLTIPFGGGHKASLQVLGTIRNFFEGNAGIEDSLFEVATAIRDAEGAEQNARGEIDQA
jgi:hypothetical protein